jgi:hypothetical protein
MQKSYDSGSATHIGPESCGAARKGGIEALTGERARRVFSRVRNSRSALIAQLLALPQCKVNHRSNISGTPGK